METRANPTPVRDSIATSWWKNWKRVASQVWSPPALLKAKRQNPLWRLMWTAPPPPLTSGSTITVSAEEDQILKGNPTSVAGEMAKLQVSSPNSPKPEGSETSQ